MNCMLDGVCPKEFQYGTEYPHMHPITRREIKRRGYPLSQDGRSKGGGAPSRPQKGMGYLPLSSETQVRGRRQQKEKVTVAHRAASMRGVQPSLVRCSMCEPCWSSRDTTRWWPFQQAEVRGMSLLEPLGVLTAAPAFSSSSAT